VICVLAVATATARADDEPIATSREPRPHVPAEPEPVPVPQAPEPTARDTVNAPIPGQESGRTDSLEDHDSVSRQMARGALFVPRMIFELAMYPFYQGIRVEDQYQVIEWYKENLYFRDRTIGIVPAATYETGLGFTAGVRVFSTDTFGQREHAVVQATAGGSYRLGLLASIDSGRRLGPLRLEASGNFDRRPDEPFYGIGNQGDLRAPIPGESINAFNDSTAVETFFRYQEARAVALGDLTMVSDLHLDLRGTYSQLKYSPSTSNPSSQNVYDPMTLVGFQQNTENLYGELGLRWDTRHRTSVWEPISVNSEGSLATVFAGRAHQFEAGSDFWHYGFELQHYIRLFQGPRVLLARVHGEGVTGSIADVPVTELPYLGGGAFLRGYTYARFRDRIALVGSVQYMWPVFSNGQAFIFADFGRVNRDWDGFSLDNLRVGYGGGIQLFTSDSFIIDAAIATSSNGGITLLGEFTPMLDARPRWR
jgi:hypothetical protein